MADTVSVTQAAIEQAAIDLVVDLCGPGASQSATNLRVVEDHLKQFARALASTQPAPAFPMEEVADLIDALQRIAANRPSDPDSPQRVAREALSRAALLQGKQP